MQAFLERAMTRNHSQSASETTAEGLLTARFGLEGALFAVASIGVAAWIFGYPQHVSNDLIAGAVGFVGIVVARFLKHRH